MQFFGFLLVMASVSGVGAFQGAHGVPRYARRLAALVVTSAMIGTAMVARS